MQADTADTIAAIATALGESGLGIVRLSGPGAVAIADRLAGRDGALLAAPSHTVHHAWLRDEAGRRVDEVLLTVMRAPRTYTGEDVVEIGAHGGAIPVRRVLRAVLAAGARLADRGEFTRRAFGNGRLDLSQAEAVVDLVSARTEKGADAALAALAGKLAERTLVVEDGLLDLLARLELNLDFNEDVTAVGREEIGRTLETCRAELAELLRRAPWGRRLREGATVVLVGRPNVGKSSLFNRLLEDERALVSPAPGTTRDYLEAWLDVEGIAVRLIDTAGLREGGAELEAEGVRRAEAREREADLRLVVCEAPAGITADDADVLARTAGRARLVLWNKSDLGGHGANRSDGPGDGLCVSARTGDGLDTLRAAMAQALVDGVGREPADEILPSERHEDAIRRAVGSLDLAAETWRDGGTEELLAGDVRDAAEALGEITGRTAGDEVLERIFSRFCVGK